MAWPAVPRYRHTCTGLCVAAALVAVTRRYEVYECVDRRYSTGGPNLAVNHTPMSCQ